VDINIVEKLFGLEAGQIYDEVRAIVMSYPEQSLKHKSVHYTVNERGRRWLFEGEDRTRFFMWEASPFYSYQFFNMAMKVPDKYKVNYKLYKCFYKQLSLRCAKIGDAAGGTSIGSIIPFRLRPRLRIWASRKLPAPLKTTLKRFFGSKKNPFKRSSSDIAVILDMLEDSNAFTKLIKYDILEQMLVNCGSVAFNNMLTLLLLAKQRHQLFNGSRT
jgi:hypothetical protein